jgi:outer membrane receptor protein involved in Fe transport
MSLFDFSAEKKLNKHFVVFAKIQNLFNAKYLVYINQPPDNTIPLSNNGDAPKGKTLVSKEAYGQVYQLGLRLSL